MITLEGFLIFLLILAFIITWFLIKDWKCNLDWYLRVYYGKTLREIEKELMEKKWGA